MKTLSRFVSLLTTSDRGRVPLAVVLYKLTADVVSKGMTLLVFVVAARQLRADELGVLAVAMTTGWLLGVASDAGLPLDLARVVARRADAGVIPPSVVADSMRWRARLGLLATAAGVLVGLLIAPHDLVVAFTLVVVAQLLTATLETLSHAFRGFGRSDIEASVTLAQRAAAGVAACGVLLGRPSLLPLALVLAISPALALVVSFRLLRRLTRRPADNQHTVENAGLSERYLREVAPMGLGIFLSAVYFRCDVFFIEHWHGLDAVGVYNAAFRSVEALRLVPAALMAVVFPWFCTARTLGPLATTVAWLVAAAALPTLTLVLAAAPILELVYGTPFAAAAPALQILALALPLFFVNYALTHQVLAWDGQRAYLGIVLAALATSLTANAVLVPAGGMRGAATATLLTELVVAAGCVAALAVQRGRARPQAAPAHAQPMKNLSSASLPGGRA